MPDNDKHRQLFKKIFDKNDEDNIGIAEKHLVKMYKVHISGLMTNDYHMTKINNALKSGPFMTYRRYKQGKKIPQALLEGILENERI